METILSLRFFIFQYGIVYKLHLQGDNTSLTVYGFSWIVFAVLLILFKIAVAWKAVHSVELLYDAGIGMLIFIPIAFLSWFPFVSTFQTQPMFNERAGNSPNTGV